MEIATDADLLQQQFDEAKRQADMEANRVAMMSDLLAHCTSWLNSARNWRLQSYESKWHEYQRDADAIYDPTLKAKKEKWQSTAFIPIIPAHRGTIKARLYKMIVGARPMLEVKARFTLPPEMDQSENVRDFILREMEKSRFEVGYESVLDDKTTFGSGFCRVRFENLTEERPVRVPDYGKVDPLAIQMAIDQGQLPAQMVGYKEELQPVTIYRGIKFEPLSIWDVFPDPGALDVKGNPIAYRFDYTYGDIIKGVEEGYFNPESAEDLKGGDRDTPTPPEKLMVDSDREIAPEVVNRTEYGRKIECFEFYARLPKKWVLINGQQIDNPEKLVPARVLFVPGKTVLAVEFNDSYDGEPPIYKDDYEIVAGQFYGRGIPEMLKDIQDVINESVNQRLDSNSITLNPKFAVIDKALVDRKDLDPGPAAIRLNSKYVTDVRQGFQQVDYKGIDKAAYIDPQEMERYAQEITSANRQTLGTAGQVHDQNETLGGMRLLAESAGERFAYLGMRSEFSFFYQIFRAYWMQIYKNIQPEDVERTLGPQRAQAFQLLTPEQIEQDYIYQPQGIFEMQNKNALQGRLQSIIQMFGGLPWFNMEAAFDKVVKTVDLEPGELKLTPDELYEKLMAEGMMQMNSMPLPNSPKTQGAP
jgi:hypothetical protein